MVERKDTKILVTSLLFIVLTFRLVEASEFLDYTKEHLFDCQNHSYTYQQIEEILIIHEIDFWIFIVLSPIGFIFTAFIMVTFYQHKETRKSPGDIILALSLADMLLNIHFFASSMNYEFDQYTPLNNHEFCQVNSFISISLSIGQFLYNCAFCIALYDKVRYSIRIGIKDDKTNLFLHSSVVFISISIWAVFFYLDKTGLNLSGLCSFKVWEEFPYVSMLLIFIYIALSIRTIYYILKQIPRTKRFQRQRKEVKYYIVYLIFSAFLWTSMAITQFIINLNCQQLQNPALNITITLCNLFKMMCPLLLPIIRFNDPIIKSQVKKVLQTFQKNMRKIFCCCWKQKSQKKIKKFIQYSKKSRKIDLNSSSSNDESDFERKFEKQKSNQSESEIEQDDINEESKQYFNEIPQNIRKPLIRNIQLESDIQQRNFSVYQNIEDIIASALTNDKDELVENNSQVNGIQDLVSSLKQATMQTIIASLYFEMKDFQNVKFKQIQKIDEEYFGETRSKPIFSALVKEEFPDLDDNEILFMTVQCFAPKVFRSIFPVSQHQLNLQDSMNIKLNNQCMELIKLKNGPQGRSGQFIFFSHDNQLVVKTLKSKEVVSLLENLNDYAIYLSNSPESFLNKFIGLYCYQRQGDRDFVLLMENILRVPRQFIISIYDLKGSTHNRETLNDKEIDEPNIQISSRQSNIDFSDIILKDMDFFQIEQYVHISTADMVYCLNALEKDIEFLTNCDILDYSLLIVKVSWRRLILEQGQKGERIQNNLLQNQQIFASVKSGEEGIYYHLAIIDYLQQWNLKKRIENTLQILCCYKNPSVQAPHQYGARFREKIINPLFKRELYDD